MYCRVLHVAIEGGPATFGGLGNVASQMMIAQNQFKIDGENVFDASIITPYYPTLFKSYCDKVQVAEIEHVYENTLVKSTIYLKQYNGIKHYLIEPSDDYKYLFDITELHNLYLDTEATLFIERLKYYNSAVAAYVGKGPTGINHPDPQILQLHDWQAALVPKLLTGVYNNTDIKTVFMVHIDNWDRGTYPGQYLEGIGLDYLPETCVLKAMGLAASDQIVVVSPRLLQECIDTYSHDAELEYLRKIYTIANARKTATGITNGINYANYCPLGKLINDPLNVYAEKQRLKQQLATMLNGSRGTWSINPELPLILYVGRYSPEKGVDTFEQLIQALHGRAIFIAIGRSITSDVYNVVLNYSRQTDNVFVTFSESEQSQFLQLVRAAADFMYVPSRREACGLVAPEGLANGAICLTTGVGGIRDLITPINYSDPDNTYGNGIFFEVFPEGQENPDLYKALDQALLLWYSLTPEQKNAMQIRLIDEAKQFDWQASGGSLKKYLDVFMSLLEPQNLTHKSKPRP